jgi:hypothetical protein
MTLLSYLAGFVFLIVQLLSQLLYSTLIVEKNIQSSPQSQYKYDNIFYITFIATMSFCLELWSLLPYSDFDKTLAQGQQTIRERLNLIS